MQPNKRFIVLQDDKKKKTWIFEDELGWVEQPAESWDLWGSQHRTMRKYPNTFMQLLGLG